MSDENKIFGVSAPVTPTEKRKEENTLENIDKPKKKNSSERIETNFKTHNDLRVYLENCDEDERKKIIESFFTTNRTDKYWEDVIQRGFLGYFCNDGDEANAKKVVELCFDPRSQEGRIQKYNSFFGKYEGKITKVIKQELSNEERIILSQCFKINSTSKFREALDLGLIEVAEVWIKNIEETNIYKNLEGAEFNNFVKDRKRELKKEVEKK